MSRKKNEIESTLKDELVDFINKVVNSYVAWDILTFLYVGRERKIATMEEITDSIGREKNEIIPVLKNFEKMGYVLVEDRIGKEFFSITTDKEKLKGISEFVRFADTREGRLKIIYFITKYRMEY